MTEVDEITQIWNGMQTAEEFKQYTQRIIETAKHELWEQIKNMQMTKDKEPFLDGYLCLSEKQCNDIEHDLSLISDSEKKSRS